MILKFLNYFKNLNFKKFDKQIKIQMCLILQLDINILTAKLNKECITKQLQYFGHKTKKL